MIGIVCKVRERWREMDLGFWMLKNKMKMWSSDFKHESESVATIIGLDGDDVVVAAVVLEVLGSKEERNKGDMAGVHGLEGEPGGGAIKVCVIIKDLMTSVFKWTRRCYKLLNIGS